MILDELVDVRVLGGLVVAVFDTIFVFDKNGDRELVFV